MSARDICSCVCRILLRVLNESFNPGYPLIFRQDVQLFFKANLVQHLQPYFFVFKKHFRLGS